MHALLHPDLLCSLVHPDLLGLTCVICPCMRMTVMIHLFGSDMIVTVFKTICVAKSVLKSKCKFPEEAVLSA